MSLYGVQSFPKAKLLFLLIFNWKWGPPPRAHTNKRHTPPTQEVWEQLTQIQHLFLGFITKRNIWSNPCFAGVSHFCLHVFLSAASIKFAFASVLAPQDLREVWLNYPAHPLQVGQHASSVFLRPAFKLISPEWASCPLVTSSLSSANRSEWTGLSSSLSTVAAV